MEQSDIEKIIDDYVEEMTNNVVALNDLLSNADVKLKENGEVIATIVRQHEYTDSSGLSHKVGSVEKVAVSADVVEKFRDNIDNSIAQRAYLKANGVNPKDKDAVFAVIQKFRAENEGCKQIAKEDIEKMYPNSPETVEKIFDEAHQEVTNEVVWPN